MSRLEYNPLDFITRQSRGPLKFHRLSVWKPEDPGGWDREHTLKEIFMAPPAKPRPKPEKLIVDTDNGIDNTEPKDEGEQESYSEVIYGTNLQFAQIGWDGNPIQYIYDNDEPNQDQAPLSETEKDAETFRELEKIAHKLWLLKSENKTTDKQDETIEELSENFTWLIEEFLKNSDCKRKDTLSFKDPAKPGRLFIIEGSLESNGDYKIVWNLMEGLEESEIASVKVTDNEDSPLLNLAPLKDEAILLFNLEKEIPRFKPIYNAPQLSDKDKILSIIGISDSCLDLISRAENDGLFNLDGCNEFNYNHFGGDAITIRKLNPLKNTQGYEIRLAIGDKEIKFRFRYKNDIPVRISYQEANQPKIKLRYNPHHTTYTQIETDTREPFYKFERRAR